MTEQTKTEKTRTKSAADLALDLEVAYYDDLEAEGKDRGTWKPSSHWASNVGHPCNRYLYNKLVHPDRAEPFPREIRARFRAGRLWEREIVADLSRDAGRLGFKVHGQQKSFQLDDLNIRGKIDVLLTGPGVVVPGEIKTMSSFSFAETHSPEDFAQSQAMYKRKYYGQLQTYIMAEGAKEGLFILRDKDSNLPRYIATPADKFYQKVLVSRMKLLNDEIKSQSPPELPPDDIAPLYCEGCEFAAFCWPNGGIPVPVVNNERLLEALRAKEELKASKKEYEKWDKIAKEEIARSAKAFFRVGEFEVKRTYIEEKEMPPTVRRAHWRPLIKRIKEGS